MQKINRHIFIIIWGLILISCAEKQQDIPKAKEVIRDKVTWLYTNKPAEALDAITYDEALNLFTAGERKALATSHWMFDVNVPVVVSVIRSQKQEMVPFWLETDGFVKTDMTLSNEMGTYEVWQKEFDAGTVGLGINGLENFSLHYFVCVGAKNNKDLLELSNFYPENQFVGIMDNGAFTYHDWDELVLENVPESLKGQKLLTTVRGRGTESHLVRAFRSSKFPSSEEPDQVMLTWSGDPATSVDVQWRTNTSVESGVVEYHEMGSDIVERVPAEKYEMEDLLLRNDRFIHRFTAKLQNLKPGVSYGYRIGSQEGWPGNQVFTTASNDDHFSWLWFGDIHNSPEWGKMARMAFEKHPDVDFVSVAGDMVGDGLHRNQWDEVFEYSAEIISQKPFMNVLGNHDNRGGLGALMYEKLFSYPENGPDKLIPEHTYSFTYNNALFLMIDATSKDEYQTGWIEEQLKNSNAAWKFAMFHFPPYNWEGPYLNLQKLWVPLFDKYGVDMVFSGHIHYYMRSKPMRGGEVVDSYKNGTAYIISVGIPSRTPEIVEEPYAEVQLPDGQFYQYLKCEGNQLKYMSFNAEGEIIDSFTLEK